MILKSAFDFSHSQALLKMAIEENLITGKDSKAELINLKNVEISDELRNSVLEQVVLTPKVLSYTHTLYKDYFSGELIDKGILEFVEAPKWDYEEYYNFPLPVVQGMARLRGLKLSQIEILNHLIERKSRSKLYKDFWIRQGKEGPDQSVGVVLKLNENLKSIAGYSEEEISVYKEFYDYMFNSDVTVIHNCISNYKRLVKLAGAHEGTLIKVLSEAPQQQFDIKKLVKAKDEVVLFRIVAEELGEKTHYPTLKQSLELSKESETKSLRFQLSNWLDKIAEGEITELEKIRKDILKARRSLIKRNSYSKAANLVTHIGVPLGLLSLITPISALPGISLSIIGSISTGVVQLNERKYNWAMFGNK